MNILTGEEFVAVLMIGLLIWGVLQKLGILSSNDTPSRWDCAELDQDHVLNQGICTICGKSFQK